MRYPPVIDTMQTLTQSTQLLHRSEGRQAAAFAPEADNYVDVLPPRSVATWLREHFQDDVLMAHAAATCATAIVDKGVDSVVLDAMSPDNLKDLGLTDAVHRTKVSMAVEASPCSSETHTPGDRDNNR